MELCNFSDNGLETYKNIIHQHNISTRSTGKLMKVARTIADIEDSDYIEPSHVETAKRYVIGGLLRDVRF